MDTSNILMEDLHMEALLVKKINSLLKKNKSISKI
jgi:hypothetical protein